MPTIKNGQLAFRRHELANVARRAGFTISRHWARWSGGFWLYRLRGRPRRGPLPGPGRRAGLDFGPTDRHTAAERVFLYCMLRRTT